MKSHHQFLLKPCSGRVRLGIQNGHLYSVKDTLNETILGFITLENANKKFGKGSFDISCSSSLCPVCSNDIKNGDKLVLIS